MIIKMHGEIFNVLLRIIKSVEDFDIIKKEMNKILNEVTELQEETTIESEIEKLTNKEKKVFIEVKKNI